MKKTLLIGVFALFSLPLAQAQFYVQARGGYAFSVAKERVAALKMLSNADPKNADGIRYYNSQKRSENQSEVTFGTGGEGLTGNLTFGYFFNKHVGAELGISHFSSKTSLVQETDALPFSENYRIYARFEAQSDQIRVMPSIVVRGGDKGVQPYARFGLLLPVYGQVNIKNDVIYDAGYKLTKFENGEQISKQTNNIVFNGAFSLGYNSAFGVHIPLSDHTSVNFEAELLTLGIRGGKSKVVASHTVSTDYATQKVILDSEDVSLGFPKVYDQEVEYVDEINSESNVQSAGYNYNPDKPRNELRRVSSYTSLGVYMGLRYTF
jgi:Outer membrane protein beta-barrel domain